MIAAVPSSEDVGERDRGQRWSENKLWVNRESDSSEFELPRLPHITRDGAIADFENLRTLDESPCYLVTALRMSSLCANYE